MKTLLLILALATTQLFALSVYNENSIGKVNENCIIHKSGNNLNKFIISSPRNNGLAFYDFLAALSNTNTLFNTKQCTLFPKNGLNLNFKEAEKNFLGFIPSYYQIQVKLKNGSDEDYTCSGSLFKLGDKSLMVLTAQHCINPLNVKSNQVHQNSIMLLKEGIFGNEYNNITLVGHKSLADIDIGFMLIKNNDLILGAEAVNATVKSFEEQIKLNQKAIYKTLDPLFSKLQSNTQSQFFFFGGAGFYNNNATVDNQHAISTAYLFTNNSAIFTHGSKNNFNYYELNTKLDEKQQLLFCNGDSGGALVKYDLKQKKYLFLGMLVAGSKEFDNKCGTLNYFVPSFYILEILKLLKK